MDEPRRGVRIVVVSEGDFLGGEERIFSQVVSPSWLGESLELGNILTVDLFVNTKHVASECSTIVFKRLYYN